MKTNDRTSSKIINKPEEWFRFIRRDDIEIQSAYFYGENVQVYYKEKNDVGSVETSVIHAAMIASYGRLKLYEELEQLQDRVLYFDTDSIIFVERPGCYNPPTGEFLGEWKNELKTGDHIVTFVSAGPKNYAYITAKGNYYDLCCMLHDLSFMLHV
jgi:hypothetical protein